MGHPLLVHMLVWITVRTRDGVEFCDEPSRGRTLNSCAYASSWGRGNQLTGPAAWRYVLSAYRQCEEAKGTRQSRWPTILFNQGHCACFGANPTSGKGLINERNVSLGPAGVHRNRPKPGSDERVTSKRSCPSDAGCQGPTPAPWCVGVHGCSAVYRKSDFTGGLSFGR